MVNTLSINASYKNQRHQFHCSTKSDFLNQAAEKFKIDDIHNNVEMYAIREGDRHQIVDYNEIKDKDFIEIEDKSTRNGHQRRMDSYIEQKNAIIIDKLKRNSALTGQERKDLVILIQSYPQIVSNKRKFDGVSPEPKKFHKKVQVNLPLTNSKDSTTQTDKITLPASREVAIAEETVTDKLKRLVSKPDVNKREIAKLMTESFDDRRLFIRLKSPPVSNLKEKYPFLFDLDEVKNEVSRIFYSEKPKEFIDNMYKYAPLIVQKCKNEDLLRRTKKSMDRSPTNLQRKYAEVVGSIFILTDLVNEQWRFIHLQDYPSGSDDIYPHIDASCHTLKEVFFDGLLFSIKVEGLKLCDASNFLEAILCLMAAFFIFNIDYPPTCRRTMIMFEKLYLKANDTEDIDEHTDQMVKLLELEGRSQNRK